MKDNRTWATTMMARNETLGSLEGFIRGKSTGFNDWFDIQFEMYWLPTRPETEAPQ